MRYPCQFLLHSLCLLALASCSSPTASAPAYPQNPAVSDALGHPRDTTTFYFPAADSLHAKYLPKSKWPEVRYNTDVRLSNCAYELQFASYTLTYFDAPVLSNYYLGTDTYRFLWLRSFHRPVLLTLRKTPIGATLRTQLLDKSPCFVHVDVFPPTQLLQTASPAESAQAIRRYNEAMADPEFQKEVAEGKRRAAQVKSEESTVLITPAQWEQFQALVKDSNFNSLPACQPDPGVLDGADWLLESHQPTSYHMVSRHSPDKSDSFRAACEYLIDLSSVRNEERY
ncbi:hypothetical protein [Hymenobacter wooponensis]|uniref:Uncharacterized protein n=1 Tax=Hymenobacter wooponensis TaxID=1525360 RepID=A0A4Z0MMG2_9BACT|nr:hypothetical protein [Hymenobacter wooponensis]TGD80365.1 hypothetical protein EU557_11010 [Hymenobacter wooponensis]